MVEPLDETRRLEILRRYNILYTPAEEVFDRITFMAAMYFHAPMAPVSFVDTARQWFKAAYGLDIREMPRNISFCEFTIRNRRVTVFPDTAKDPAFDNNPLVHGDQGLRFYAGAPVLTRDGESIGTVAVLDYVPRAPLSPEDERFLQYLADIVLHELEIRLAASDVQAEIELRQQSEERLQLAVSHTPITLAVIDRDLRCTWVINPPPPFRAEDLIGKTSREIWPGELGESLYAVKREVLRTGEGRRMDFDAPPLQGVTRHFDVVVEPRRDGGRIVGLSFAAIDVTDRKRAEHDLAVAEARHRAALETSVDGVIVADETGAIRQFSPGADRIFGYSEQEVMGEDVSILMPEPHRSGHCGYIQRYLATGEARIIGIGREVEAMRKDGTLVPIDLQIREWHQDDVRMFTATVRDITKRRDRERALRQAEQERAEALTLLNTMLESIPDAVFCKDRGGRYIVANPATAKALGVENLIGRYDREVLPEALATKMRTLDAQVMASGVPGISEDALFDFQRGEHRWYVTSKMPLRDRNGTVIGVVGLARDITERRQMVEALETARNAAETANRAKSSFLAAASHDLRQPVQALTLFTSALEERLADHPAAALAALIRQALVALQGLLESLLDISRLDAGVVEVNLSRLSLGEIITPLEAEYAARASAKGLRFRVTCADHWTETDPKLLGRVLRNLLENALRYTDRGGILLGCRRRSDRLMLQVVDTGIGIPHEKVEAVFQEFVQLHNEARDRSKGLGLGLAIVRRLLALMGHTLEVRSVPGRGTTFSIALPRVATERESRPIPKVAPVRKAMGTREVLVIEDEVMVRQGIEMLVDGWGCHALPAADEDEAVAVATKHRMPDRIIADYRLQNGRLGTDAVRAVQQACGRAIPAIIVTGDTAPERIAEVKASGFAMAHKPVDPDRLHSFIEEGR
jgi:PAS domain S-box-containing protein